MAKKEEVWVCTATMIPTFGVPFIADLQLSDEERWRNGIFKNQRGEELDADWFPQESHVDPKMFDYLAKYEGKKLTYKKGLPYFFGCGYYYVSLELADVLRQFDLGNGALYPTRFFEVDGKTSIPGEYFCLHFGNVKEAFLPDQSPKAWPWGFSKVPSKWKPSIAAKNGDIAVSGAALEGPDIWIDAKFWQAFFISGRLMRALKKAKLSRRFSVRKCRIVDQHI